MKILSLFLICIFGAWYAVATPMPSQDKAIVLVHGAFADGSSWARVIPLLKAKGYEVVAVQNPLTSLADDVATVKRAIENQKNPVILVGHSWGGVVITELGNNPKVAALVYVAAFAPAEGESVLSLMTSAKNTAPGNNETIADQFGYMSLTERGVLEDFAQDLPKKTAEVLFSTQGPVAASSFGTKTSLAAWKAKPTWYIVADKDRMIPPELEATMAKNINAKVAHVNASHAAMLSKPSDVAAVILEAAEMSGN